MYLVYISSFRGSVIRYTSMLYAIRYTSIHADMPVCAHARHCIRHHIRQQTIIPIQSFSAFCLL